MTKRTLLTALSAITATILMSGCTQASVKPEVVATYHFDTLNKEFKDHKLNSIAMKNAILAVSVSATSYTPEYKTNNEVIVTRDCSEREYNEILNLDIQKCKNVYTNKYIEEDGHMYTDKFKKTYEGAENTVFMIDYTITSLNENNETITETFNNMIKTDENGTATLDFKPLVFNSIENPTSLEVKVTTDAIENHVYKVTVGAEDLAVLKDMYKAEKEAEAAKLKKLEKENCDDTIFDDANSTETDCDAPIAEVTEAVEVEDTNTTEEPVMEDTEDETAEIVEVEDTNTTEAIAE